MASSSFCTSASFPQSRFLSLWHFADRPARARPRLKPGCQLHSFACVVCGMCGVDRSIVQRAEYVSEACRSHSLGLLRREIAEMQHEEQQIVHPASTDEMRCKEAIVRRFVSIDFTSIDPHDSEALGRMLEEILSDPQDN